MVREGVLALRREQEGNWPQEAFVCAILSLGAEPPDSMANSTANGSMAGQPRMPCHSQLGELLALNPTAAPNRVPPMM